MCDRFILVVQSTDDDNPGRDASKVGGLVLLVRLTVHLALIRGNKTTWTEEVALWKWPTL